MDRGAWQSTVHRDAKSQTREMTQHVHTYAYMETSDSVHNNNPNILASLLPLLLWGLFHMLSFANSNSTHYCSLKKHSDHRKAIERNSLKVKVMLDTQVQRGRS